jgi:CheY-like chemotaxis protein
MDEGTLLKAVRAAVTHRKPMEGASLVTRYYLREGRRSLRILLAEDNPINQEVTSILLRKWGHDVVQAYSGREALKAVVETEPDLVLMDLEMPEMSGLEATASIRQDEEGTAKHVPIIAMTAHALQGDRDRCLLAGMDAYVSKPLRSEELSRVIEEVMAGSNRTGSKRTEGADAEGQAPAPGGHCSLSDALGYVAGDKVILAAIIKMFLAVTPQTMSDVVQAAADGDVDELGRLAHRLKGALPIFGAARAIVLLEELVQAAREGKKAKVQDRLQRLLGEMSSLQENLRTMAKEVQTCRS